MPRDLIRSAAFIRAARKYVKKHPQAADDIEAALQLMADDVSTRGSRLTSSKATSPESGPAAQGTIGGSFSNSPTTKGRKRSSC